MLVSADWIHDAVAGWRGPNLTETPDLVPFDQPQQGVLLQLHVAAQERARREGWGAGRGRKVTLVEEREEDGREETEGRRHLQAAGFSRPLHSYLMKNRKRRWESQVRSAALVRANQQGASDMSCIVTTWKQVSPVLPRTEVLFRGLGTLTDSDTDYLLPNPANTDSSTYLPSLPPSFFLKVLWLL